MQHTNRAMQRKKSQDFISKNVGFFSDFTNMMAQKYKIAKAVVPNEFRPHNALHMVMK